MYILWAYVSPNSYVETINPIVAVFGDETFKGVIKVKESHKGRALIR